MSHNRQDELHTARRDAVGAAAHHRHEHHRHEHHRHEHHRHHCSSPSQSFVSRSRITGALLALAASVSCTNTDEVRAVTYHQDIAPLVAARCGSCHTEGSIAPFALEDVDTVTSLAPVMLAAVEDGSMPPWLAQETDECQPRLPWKNDLRLTEDEKQLFRDWVAAGTPPGDEATASPLPSPPELSLSQPSVSMAFEQPYTVDGENDDFQCFVLDPGHDEPVWVTAAQLTPGNEVVAHHGLVFLDLDGTSQALADEDGRFECFNPPSISGFLLATWTPGAVPMVTPETTGMPMPVGAKIVVQMHYHPTGKGPEQDRSSVELAFTNEQPRWEVAQVLLGNFSDRNDDGTGLQPGPNDRGGEPEFVIPAGIADHLETLIYRQSIPLSFPLYSVGTHMHYVGTDMLIELVHKLTGEPTECLVHTPAWDFNWQRVYDYDAPIEALPVIGPGDELHMRCSYDNTMNNPFVAAALRERNEPFPVDVTLGEETLDEMCLGLFGIVVEPGVLQTVFGN